MRKFDAYRLKIKEIKRLRVKKMPKTPYFSGFFLIFSRTYSNNYKFKKL